MNSPFVSPSIPRVGRQAAIAAAGIVALGIPFELLRRLGNLKLYVVETIGVCLAAGVLYLILIYLFEHTPDDAAAFGLILAGALLFRLTLVSLPPSLSDDVYRYVWDARVQQEGLNPYGLRPDDAQLRHLRDTNFLRIPGRDIPTVYPPLVQLVFRGTIFFTQDPIRFKLPIVFADLLVVLLLAGWLRGTGGRNYVLALYAWNPLVIVEFAASGHYDSLAIVATLAACLLLARKRDTLSTLLLAAGALLKAFPALLLPLWLRRSGWPRTRRSWLNLSAALALALVCALPYWRAWSHFFESLQYYESSWRNNNASLAWLLDWCSGSHDLTVGVAAGVAVGLAVWVTARQVDSVRAAFLLIGATLLLSPNAFSWYFTWIIPFLCFFPNPAWLMLTVLQFLSYHVLIDYQAFGEWQFRPLFLLLTYGPFFAYLAVEKAFKEISAERNSLM